MVSLFSRNMSLFVSLVFSAFMGLPLEAGAVLSNSNCQFSLFPPGMNFPPLEFISNIHVIASDASCAWSTTEASVPDPTLTKIKVLPNGHKLFQFSGVPKASYLFQWKSPSAEFYQRPVVVNADHNGFFAYEDADAALYPTRMYQALANSWLRIHQGGSGVGSGSLQYAIDGNSAGTSRVGTMLVAGQTFTVFQEASPAACSYSLSQDLISARAKGGRFEILVTPNLPNCSWTPASNNAWIKIISSEMGMTGAGSFTLQIMRNKTKHLRLGSIVVGGQKIQVTESGTKPLRFRKLRPPHRLHVN